MKKGVLLAVIILCLGVMVYGTGKTSIFRMLTSEVTDEGIKVRWFASQSSTQIVERTEALPSSEWDAIHTNYPPNEGTQEYLDVSSPPTSGYYRVNTPAY